VEPLTQAASAPARRIRFNLMFLLQADWRTAGT